jgi:hypothetical protein
MNKSNFGIVTKQNLLDHLAARWREQYPNSSRNKNNSFYRVYIELKEAGKNLTEEMAAKIIGNDTWTKLNCDCCFKDCERLVTISMMYRDCEFVSLCEDCLSEAMFKLGKSKELSK